MNPPFTQQSSLSPMRYRVAGSATGREERRTACTKVKIAVLAPMPSATVRTTVAVNPGNFTNWRRANLRSCIPDFQQTTHHMYKPENHDFTKSLDDPGAFRSTKNVRK